MAYSPPQKKKYIKDVFNPMFLGLKKEPKHRRGTSGFYGAIMQQIIFLSGSSTKGRYTKIF